MKPKILLLLIGGLWLAMLGCFLYHSHQADIQEPVPAQLLTSAFPSVGREPSAPLSLAPGRAVQKTSSGVRLHPVAERTRQRFQTLETTPDEDRQYLEMIVQTYVQLFDTIPTGGENAEITAALRGGNPKALALLDPEAIALNVQGELLDRWGNPWVFHPISRQELEIVSRGQDGALWTADDVGHVTSTGQVDGAGGLVSPNLRNGR